MEMKKLDGFLLARLLHGGAANLKANKQAVNDLNVFPIPDGDTGDNMFMTIDAGVVALADEPAAVGEAARLAANGMLLGARGNSGVITGGKVNPLIGSAGVSAVPMAARVSQKVGAEYDPSNFLLMHAMGPNVAGVIGTAVVAGVFMAVFGIV